MQINPMCEEFRGGYKEVASASGSSTWGQKLLALSSAYSALSPSQKRDCLVISNDGVFQICGLTKGLFVRTTLATNAFYIEQFNITEGIFIFDSNGSFLDYSNVSTSVTLALYAREE